MKNLELKLKLDFYKNKILSFQKKNNVNSKKIKFASKIIEATDPNFK